MVNNLDDKKLHIILFEPEIAGNVGTIMRTCVALNARLHLIEPFGFFLDDRFVKRASASYFEYADYVTYDDYHDFQTRNPNIKIYYSTRYGQQVYSDIDYTKDAVPIYVMFGRESTGIPKTILQEHLDHCFRIPMHEHVRSLNVANTVNIVGYEIMRQCDFVGLSKYEVQKGKDYLTE